MVTRNAIVKIIANFTIANGSMMMTTMKIDATTTTAIPTSFHSIGLCFPWIKFMNMIGK